MPLTLSQQKRFREIAAFLHVAPNKIDKMVAIGNKLQDKQGRPVGAHGARRYQPGQGMDPNTFDFSLFSKDVFALYLAPDIRRYHEASLGYFDLILIIVILWFVLHYFADDWRKQIQEALGQVQRGVKNMRSR